MSKATTYHIHLLIGFLASSVPGRVTVEEITNAAYAGQEHWQNPPSMLSKEDIAKSLEMAVEHGDIPGSPKSAKQMAEQFFEAMTPNASK